MIDVAIAAKIVHNIIQFSKYFYWHFHIVDTFCASKLNSRSQSPRRPQNLFSLVPTISWHKCLDRIDVRGYGGSDSVQHLLTCLEQAIPPNDLIKNCRGIKEKREKPRRTPRVPYPLVCSSRAYPYPLICSSKADEFFDEYRGRLQRNQGGQRTNSMDNRLLLSLSSMYHHCASSNMCLWMQIGFYIWIASYIKKRICYEFRALLLGKYEQDGCE